MGGFRLQPGALSMRDVPPSGNVGAAICRPWDAAMMMAGAFRPPFSFPSCGKENGLRPVQKKRPLFCRAPVQWPSALTGVSRIGADETSGLLPARAGPLIFPGLVPRVRRGGRWGGHRMVSAPEPAAAGPEVDGGLCNGLMWVSAPTDAFSAEPFVGADVHIRPCRREGPGSA